MKYQVNTDSFEAALVALVQAFQRENPGASYACEMNDGTKVKITVGRPKAPKKAKATKR